jgi:predicted negative regulator of RcsB-dependent stress response
MEAYTTEEQQVARLKKLWKDNASSIVTGIVLGLSALYGFRYWTAWQEDIARQASNVYVSALLAQDAGNESVLMEKTSELITDYNKTPYAVLAALMKARIQIEAGDLEAAEEQIHWALDHSSAEVMQLIARLRLARVQMEQGKLEDAESTLNSAVPSGLFAALYNELRGDIHMARGDTQKARDVYQVALIAMPPGTPGHKLLQLKHDNSVMQANQGAPQ